MIWLYLSLASSAIDNFGVTFEGNDFKVLTKCNEKLTEYTLPIETTVIKAGTKFVNAFGSCKALKAVMFLENCELETIGSFSFYQSNIESIDFINCSKLKEIQDSAFLYCSKLTSIIFSDSITSLGPSCFMSTSVKSIVLPLNLASLIKGVFYSISIQEFIFPPNCLLSSIQYESCKLNISKLTIPKSVTTLQNGFFECPLKEIEVEDGNENYVSIDSIVYTKDMKTIVMSPMLLDSIKLNKSVTKIDIMAFRGCMATSIDLGNVEDIKTWALASTKFSSVTFPSTLSSADSNILAHSNVENVQIEEGIKYIPSRGFYACQKLKYIHIARSITTIHESAFELCSSLQELFIPSTITIIKSGALSKINETCNITFEEGSVFKKVNGFVCTSDMQNALFYLGPKGGEITVPGVKVISKGLFYQMSFSEILISNSVTTVETEAFAGTSIGSLSFSNLTTIKSSGFISSSINSIEFGQKLTGIDKEAFKNCVNLVSINFPPSLQQIGPSVFEGCEKLETVKFEPGCGAWSIGDFCFARTYLDIITIPYNISSIGVYCFEGSVLTTLKFHTDSILTKIPDYSFSYASKLELIEFSESIKVIGISSFEGCNGLISFKLPNSLINISTTAFKNCKNLESIAIPDRSHLQNIFGLAFEGCEKLATIEVSEKNKYFSYDDGVLYDKEKTQIVIYLPANPRSIFEIKDSVQNIGPYSFYGCYNLVRVSIPKGINSIGFQAFKDCFNLRYLNLPYTLNQIFGETFSGCINLKECGSVLYCRETQKDLLLNAGISLSALEDCATMKFTGCNEENSIIFLFFSIPVLKSTERDSK